MSYMGKYCISCGTELPTAAKFCNQCGKSQIEELNINKSQEVQSRKNGHDSKSHKDILLTKLNDALSYFSKKKDLYDRYESLQGSKKYMTNGEAALWYVFGILIACIIWIFIPGDGFIWTFLSFIDFVYVGLVYPYNRNQKKFVERTRLNNKIENDLVQIEEELQLYYDAYSNKIVSFEYAHPTIIKELIQNISSNRADNLKEAINCLLEDVHKEQMLSKQIEIAQNSKEAAIAAKTAAIFTAGTFLNTRNKRM